MLSGRVSTCFLFSVPVHLGQANSVISANIIEHVFIFMRRSRDGPHNLKTHRRDTTALRKIFFPEIRYFLIFTFVYMTTITSYTPVYGSVLSRHEPLCMT